VENVYVGGADEAVGQLIDAFEQVVATQPIHDRLRDQKVRDWKTAVGRSLISAEEVAKLEAAERAIAAVIEVDDFAPAALAAHERRVVSPAETGPPRTPVSPAVASVH
jgi:acyl-CoA dehydrogenase